MHPCPPYEFQWPHTGVLCPPSVPHPTLGPITLLTRHPQPQTPPASACLPGRKAQGHDGGSPRGPSLPCSPACGPLVARGQTLLQLSPLSLGLGWLAPLPPSSLTQTSVSPTPYLKVGPHPTLFLCLFSPEHLSPSTPQCLLSDCLVLPSCPRWNLGRGRLLSFLFHSCLGRGNPDARADPAPGLRWPRWPCGLATCRLRAVSCSRLASSSSAWLCMVDSCARLSRRESLKHFWVSSSSRMLLLYSSEA